MTESGAKGGEDRLIAWLRRHARGAGGERLGDDAATLPPGGPWAVTVDTQIAGVHFPPGLDPRRLARRLLAVNLSDLAAMGAVPRHAFLALAAPPRFDHRRFLAALVAACRHHGLELAGGDLARSPQLTAVLTLLGVQTPGGRWLARDAARPGDGLWLGGSLGESAAGRRLLAAGATWHGAGVRLPAGFPASPTLARAARRAVRRHLAPRPQLELGCHLARRPRAAAIDVSDGLALDLSRLCRESGAGARVEAAALPASPGLPRLAHHLGADVEELLLAGGEDYVLLFTLPPDEEPEPAFDCFRIGHITSRRSLLLVGEGGTHRPLRPAGWDHLTAR